MFIRRLWLKQTALCVYLQKYCKTCNLNPFPTSLASTSTYRQQNPFIETELRFFVLVAYWVECACAGHGLVQTSGMVTEHAEQLSRVSVQRSIANGSPPAYCVSGDVDKLVLGLSKSFKCDTKQLNPLEDCDASTNYNLDSDLREQQTLSLLLCKKIYGIECDLLQGKND